MTDRPIIFSAPMIRALLDGRKTQTRRVLKPQPQDNGVYADIREAKRALRWVSGDRLWVRESFADLRGTGIEHRPTHSSPIQRAAYMADTAPGSHDDQARKDYGIKWKPSIHMPRWASRLTLIVKSVKVEQLQEISEDDAIAEGCQYIEDGPGAGFWIVPDASGPVCSEGVVECFERLWESINGPGSWDANPWVAAIAFRVVKSNIDALCEEAAP